MSVPVLMSLISMTNVRTTSRVEPSIVTFEMIFGRMIRRAAWSVPRCATVDWSKLSSYASSREAAAAGAFVLAVTNFPGSSLGKVADLVLQCASSESAVRLGAMSSRIAQLMIVDFLCVMLALAAPEKVEGSVIRTHRGIFKE